MLKLNDYLKPLFAKAEGVLDSGLADVEIDIALKKAVSAIASIEAMHGTVSERFEFPVYEQAIEEAKYAIFLISIGSYRNAYSSLRLFFELSLAAVDFSTNERQFLLWSLGRADISWGRLSEAQEGVLSKNFCNIFPLDLSDHVQSYRAMATTVYRECSEFVHGNPSANSKLPDFLTFKKESILDWCGKLDTMYLVFSFLFSARYLHTLAPEKKELIKSDLLAQLEHVAPIRDCLGGVTGG